LNTDIAKTCKCYGLYDKTTDEIIGFIGILHYPHPRNKRIKKVSRLVILPDYQGIGLGYKFLTEIAKIYTEEAYDFGIVTSAKNLIHKLRQEKQWELVRVGKVKKSKSCRAIRGFDKTLRTNCVTASFYFKGDKI
jgi:GNAT superfamily N-acetyltransferase